MESHTPLANLLASNIKATLKQIAKSNEPVPVHELYSVCYIEEADGLYTPDLIIRYRADEVQITTQRNISEADRNALLGVAVDLTQYENGSTPVDSSPYSIV